MREGWDKPEQVTAEETDRLLRQLHTEAVHHGAVLEGIRSALWGIVILLLAIVLIP